MPWLHLKYNYFEIISVFYFTRNMSETEINLFQPQKERWNYFRIISATLNMLENIYELQYSCEIILK